MSKNTSRRSSASAEIPAAGWKDIALRVKDELVSDHVGLLAAGVAFYALLAIFPAITALMALAGMVLDPAQVTAQLATLTQMIPRQAAQIILDQAVAVAGSQDAGLGIAFLIGLLLAIYSASKGMSSLMEGLNVAYDEDEDRGFIRKTLWTLGLTVFLIVGLLLGLVLLAVVRAGGLRRPGLAFGIFLSGYGLARMFVELFRVADAQFITPDNPLGHVVGGPVIGLTMGQVLSLPMVVLGVVFILRAWRRAPVPATA